MWAHPRSRGENGEIGGGLSAHLGSSPLTRGKRSYGEAGSTWDGLIPAHAGKTSGSMKGTLSKWAHPRSRGENAHGVATTIPTSGSSPLTRGKRGRRVRVRVP